MEQFQLSKFTNEGAQLLREVTDEFTRLGLDTSRLPKTFTDGGGKIKLVFVGQYSAGKSSLIKMLTGEDVAIGAAITTQDSTPYEWNGLEIVDTPGIETELRPDHDEITYEQINHAALLIFVITNEGFSQRTGDHFRKLAVDQKRAADMILVVNKMDRTQLGNVPEQQAIIYEDLKKVTAPHDPKDLYLSFTDTASYFKALDETEPRRKGRRLERSGIEIFIRNLNRFVADRGVLQKINLPLNAIAAELRNASAEPSAELKSDASALIETFRHGKQILIDERRECLEDIDGIISAFKADVAKCGRDTAQSVTSQKSESAAKKVFAAAQERVQRFAEDCAQKISDRIKVFAESSDTELNAYEQSTFVQQVKLNFAAHVLQSNGFGDAAAVGVGGAAGAFVFHEGAQIAAQFAKVAITPFGNFVGGVAKIGIGGVLAAQGVPKPLAGLLGDGAGNLIAKLPIFRAEPTIVNRIAQVFTGNGSKILGAGLAVVGAAVSLFMLYRENRKAEERERELQRKRNEISTGFNDLADDIARELLSGVKTFMSQNIDPIVANFDAQIKAVDTQAAAEDFKHKKLSELLTRTEKLIAEVQACK